MITKNNEKLKILKEIPNIPRLDSQQMMTEEQTIASIIKAQNKQIISPHEPDSHKSENLIGQIQTSNLLVQPQIIKANKKRESLGKESKGVLYLKKRKERKQGGQIQIDELN